MDEKLEVDGKQVSKVFSDLCSGQTSIPIDDPKGCPKDKASDLIKVDNFESEREIAICLDLSVDISTDMNKEKAIEMDKESNDENIETHI